LFSFFGGVFLLPLPGFFPARFFFELIAPGFVPVFFIDALIAAKKPFSGFAPKNFYHDNACDKKNAN
jgi:hypothetical protein